jgi:3-hydroxyisobutyrate dehydrogenase-like beta-hydroxyacid dehydrogenase
MVGGDLEVYQSSSPILNLLGKNILYMGKAGMGQHAKMANQIAIAGQ